ncbi:MAG: hypothetical protein KF825_03910 [Ferruginibacter sp.]|nr:hypothetical protein [Ferruginibacter sp.]
MNPQITLQNSFIKTPLLQLPDGLTQNGEIVFPFKNEAYRHVEDNNYTQNFGYQWNKFAATQIDREQKNMQLSYNRFFAVITFFNKIGIGKFINHFMPFNDIKDTIPHGLSKKEIRVRSILDTFDMFSSQYDQTQKINTLTKWFQKYGVKNVLRGPVHYDNCVPCLVKDIVA